MMRYRKLRQPPATNVFNLAGGDYSFGHGPADFYVDQPEAVAQLVLTRLGLWLGEWFLDTSDGTDWNAKVLGRRTEGTRDAVIQARTLQTPGVKEITSYSSSLDRNTREFSVNALINTIFGQVTISGPL
jgi:hypothetical protein